MIEERYKEEEAEEQKEKAVIVEKPTPLLIVAQRSPRMVSPLPPVAPTPIRPMAMIAPLPRDNPSTSQSPRSRHWYITSSEGSSDYGHVLDNELETK